MTEKILLDNYVRMWDKVVRWRGYREMKLFNLVVFTIYLCIVNSSELHGEDLRSRSLGADLLDLPVWRCDRVLTQDEWFQIIRCARRFQFASSGEREVALSLYMDGARKNGGVLTKDGVGLFDSKLRLLWRVVFDVEAVNSSYLHPIESSDHKLSLTRLAIGGTGIYAPLKELDRFQKIANHRELNMWSIKIGGRDIPFKEALKEAKSAKSCR